MSSFKIGWAREGTRKQREGGRERYLRVLTSGGGRLVLRLLLLLRRLLNGLCIWPDHGLSWWTVTHLVMTWPLRPVIVSANKFGWLRFIKNVVSRFSVFLTLFVRVSCYAAKMVVCEFNKMYCFFSLILDPLALLPTSQVAMTLWSGITTTPWKCCVSKVTWSRGWNTTCSVSTLCRLCTAAKERQVPRRYRERKVIRHWFLIVVYFLPLILFSHLGPGCRRHRRWSG